MINEESTKPFKPVQGILIYKRNSSIEYYLETHDIAEQDGKFQWQEGRPFLKEQLKDLALSLKETVFSSMDINGLIPENLLYIKQGISESTLVWYLPPTAKTLYFDKALKIKAGIIKLPGLIFASNSSGFYAVAFTGNKKPDLKTPLFKAPFYNMHPDGEVCMGNVKETKSKLILHEEIARLENRFFNSYFSHFLDEEVIQAKVNLSVLTKDLITSKKAFPESVLVPSPYKTLNDFLKKIKK